VKDVIAALPGVETFFVTPKTIVLFAASSAISSRAIEPSTRPLTTTEPCLNASRLLELCEGGVIK